VTDRAPSLAGIVERGATTVRDRVTVCRAGYVVAYDATNNRADVQLVHDTARTRPDGVVEVVAAPILRGRPVAMLAAGHLTLTAGLREGDRVWVLVSDVSLDEYVAGRRDETYRPQDPRRFDLSDGIVWPMSDPPGRMDGQPVMQLRASEALHIGDAAASLLLARADLVLAELQALQSAFNGHVHGIPPLTSPSGTVTVVPIGPNLTNVSGPTSPAAPFPARSYTAPATAAAIASSRVKVDD